MESDVMGWECHPGREAKGRRSSAGKGVQGLEAQQGNGMERCQRRRNHSDAVITVRRVKRTL